MFPHVRGRKVVERTWANWGSEQQEEQRYKIMYLSSEGSPSVERVVG